MRHPLLAFVLPLLAGALFAAGLPSVDQGPELSSDVLSLSASEGGVQVLSIAAGVEYAGYQYLIAGTSSGVFPGTAQDGLRVPLNYDNYTETLLRGISQPAFGHFRGNLDAEGKAQAKLTMPPSQVPSLIGKVYHHAAVVIDPKTHQLVDVTNPIELLLLP